MIFRAFQDGIKARLEGDAYFTQAPAVSVRVEERPAGVRKAAQDALNADAGMITIVRLPRFSRAEHGCFVFESAVETFENPTCADTHERTGFNLMAKELALLHEFEIPINNDAGEAINPFSKLRITEGGPIGEVEGAHGFRIIVESKIYIATLIMLLADIDGTFLVTEAGEPLLVTPTAP